MSGSAMAEREVDELLLSPSVERRRGRAANGRRQGRRRAVMWTRLRCRISGGHVRYGSGVVRVSALSNEGPFARVGMVGMVGQATGTGRECQPRRRSCFRRVSLEAGRRATLGPVSAAEGTRAAGLEQAAGYGDTGDIGRDWIHACRLGGALFDRRAARRGRQGA